MTIEPYEGLNPRRADIDDRNRLQNEKFPD